MVNFVQIYSTSPQPSGKNVSAVFFSLQPRDYSTTAIFLSVLPPVSPSRRAFRPTGRKEKMPQRQDQDVHIPTELNFITFGETSQSMSTRAIRSHAARVGWKSRKRTKSRNQSELAPSELPQRFVAQKKSTLGEHSEQGSHQSTPSLSSSSRSSLSTVSSCSTPLNSYSPDLTQDDAVFNASSVIPLENSGKEDEVEELPWKPPSVAISNPSLANTIWKRQNKVCRPVGNVNNPFSQFPVPWEEPFGSLVHFYKHCLGEVWLKVISANWGEEGNREFRDYPLNISIANSEPAMFYAVMSNASVMAPPSNAISMRQQPYLSQWLRSKAVASLRNAIADPKRAYTDATICTVDFIYLNEAMRGEVETARLIHGPALQRMVAARGGLYAIAANGRDGLILCRMLTWADRIASSACGIPLLFGNYTEDSSLDQTQWTGIWSKVQTMM